jgi:hypothetical protein
MDSETCRVLIAICETLKEEYVCLGAIQNSHVRFYEAVKRELPAVEKNYRDIPLTTISDPPGIVEQIRLIDLLLDRLKKQA